jgi:hypothetical protein
MQGDTIVCRAVALHRQHGDAPIPTAVRPSVGAALGIRQTRLCTAAPIKTAGGDPCVAKGGVRSNSAEIESDHGAPRSKAIMGARRASARDGEIGVTPRCSWRTQSWGPRDRYSLPSATDGAPPHDA